MVRIAIFDNFVNLIQLGLGILIYFKGLAVFMVGFDNE